MTPKSAAAPSVLGVNVPVNATVYVNGRRTQSQGAYREFELRTNRPQHSYSVRATVNDDDGRKLVQTKLAILAPGRNAQISFDFQSPSVTSRPTRDEGSVADSSPLSRLSVQVPTGASVFVNGRRTESTGAHREFAIRTGGSGHVYRVRAVVARNGLELSETKLVTLNPGNRARMSFAFDVTASDEEHVTETMLPVRVLKESN